MLVSLLHLKLQKLQPQYVISVKVEKVLNLWMEDKQKVLIVSNVLYQTALNLQPTQTSVRDPQNRVTTFA